MTTLAAKDSRRITGANILCDSPGAILDVVAEHDDPGQVYAEWRAAARRLLDAVGWRDETTCVRAFDGGASLLLTAPLDALYAATEVNEAAWTTAMAAVTGEPPPDLELTAAKLEAVIAAERNPALLALNSAAREHGVNFVSDDEAATVGMGCGSRTWPVDSLPDPTDVPWDVVHDIPLALVTGSNGKTTTIRLLAAIARAAGKTPGYSSTDGIIVGDAVVETGDYSGPEGARRVVRDTRIDIALLETARGGILRRGLPVRRADVALVTNVASDHLGEFGILDVAGIAETKLVVRHAVQVSGTLLLNADDSLLADYADSLGVAATWLSLNPKAPRVEVAVHAGQQAFVSDGNLLIILRGGGPVAVAGIADIPITLGGAARHNVYNALGAVAVATELHLAPRAIRVGLETFRSSPTNNPGRSNLFVFGDLRVFVDFAHNPHGMHALVDLANAMTANRRIIILGQAGDRNDASIRELARAAWQLAPHRIIIKEMRKYLRGRSEGEIPAILQDELERVGAPAERITHTDSELTAVREALTWARPGDLVLLPVHSDRTEVLHLLGELTERQWKPGDELPVCRVAGDK